ncbi:MAG: 16S rRNA (guanine(966)-N(2))-methyltransferase RsmD [Cyanobacteria bacterium P01_F01_bin.42]
MAIRIYGKRLIETPPGLATRPTAAKVREAVFNIWQGQIPEARWLDLCTGSGSMGAEALARGAAEVVGIELNTRACRVIHDNWRRVSRAPQKFSVLRGRVQTRLKGLQPAFDLIYFDPPYQAGLYGPVLEQINRLELLSPQGAIAAEHGREQILPDAVADLVATKRSHYGQTSLTFYQRQEDLS